MSTESKMSRSNPTVNQNPCTRYFEWDGQDGKVRYYDKEQKENIIIDLPFQFLLLDQLSKIGGWSDHQEASIYSNEVKNITKEPFTVKVHGGGVLAQGYYSDIKDEVKASGARYIASLYIAYKDDEALKIGNLSLKGAALSAWMDFSKQSGMGIWEKAVVVDGCEEGKKGTVTYQMPTFRLNKVSEETQNIAVDLDKSLQEYLKGKQPEEIKEEIKQEEQSKPPISDNPPVPDDSELHAEMDDDLPF